MKQGAITGLAFWLLLTACSIQAGSGLGVKSSLPVPTLAEYGSFLLEPWKQNTPVVTIFTDPFCPYCIQALKRREDLKSYNAFLFWYPIFGEKSDSRVAEIFNCNRPVSAQVVDAVINGVSPNCAGKKNQQLINLNQKMYEAYNPPGVPAYYLGGVKVSMAELKVWRQTIASAVPSVKLDWARYAANRLDNSSVSLSNVIILVPAHYSQAASLITALKADNNFAWYYMGESAPGDYLKICGDLAGKCESSALKLYLNNTQEIKLLYDFSAIEKPVWILNGKVLSDVEKVKYFSSLNAFM